MKQALRLLLIVVVVVLVGLLVRQLMTPGAGGLGELTGTPLEQGDAALAAGDYPRAMAKYNEALAGGTDQATVYARRANLYTVQRQYPEAIQDYTRALTLNADPEFLAGRCNAYRLLVRLDDALADCQAAFDQRPESVQVAVINGLLHVDRKDPDRARAAVEKALAANPESDRLIYVLAQVANIEGDTPRVIEELTRCIELNPKSVQYFWDRGFAYYMNAQIEEAKADLYQVIELGDPLVDGETMYFAGNLLRMMGENP